MLSTGLCTFSYFQYSFVYLQVCSVQFCVLTGTFSTALCTYRYAQYSFVVLTLLMAMFTVLAHWLACIWYFIGLEEVRHSNHSDWSVGELSYENNY